MIRISIILGQSSSHWSTKVAVNEKSRDDSQSGNKNIITILSPYPCIVGIVLSICVSECLVKYYPDDENVLFKRKSLHGS